MSVFIIAPLAVTVGLFSLFEIYRFQNKKKNKKRYSDNIIKGDIATKQILNELSNTIFAEVSDSMKITKKTEKEKLKKTIKKVVRSDCPDGTRQKKIKICI